MDHMGNLKIRGRAMLKTKNGFTLTEIIVSIALVGIIAVAVLPAFSAQLRMTANARKMTATEFEAQGAIENEIESVKELLKPPGKYDGSESQENLNIFGRQVRMQKVMMEYPQNKNKDFTVYLSEKLAEMESRNPLVASIVRIDEEQEGTTVINQGIETVSVRAKSKLKKVKGFYEIEDYTSEQDWNIYRWYRSKEGVSDPQYPQDFEAVASWRTKKTLTKEELKKEAVNRYIILGLIPVDKSGLRGEEKISQKVYVQGEEWRSDIFVWVDKNLDGQFSTEDVKVEDKVSGLGWILLRGFDTQVPFQDPANPSKNLDPKDGSLYVPMGVRREKIQDKSGKISVEGTEFIDWSVEKTIHFANNIETLNDSDIHMRTTDGSIRLYQFVDLDYQGAAQFTPEGKVILAQDGAKLQGRNIYLAAGVKNGSIIIEPKTLLKATELINLTSAKDILVEGSSLEANQIHLHSKEKDDVENISIKNTNMKATEIIFETSGTISGGGWDENTTVVVTDDKTLKVGNLVQNKGKLNLGDTGGVVFEGGIKKALEKSPEITLSKSDNTSISIDTNYGRNISYAKASPYEKINSEKIFQNLGTGQVNLLYTVEQTSGDGIVNLEYSFDGENKINIQASNLETGAYTNYYKLYVEDKYAKGIVGSIVFKVSSAENGLPIIEIIGETAPTVTITFEANGGRFEDNSTSMTIKVEAGKMFVDFPIEPVYDGHKFIRWDTKVDGSGTSVNGYVEINEDMVLYAQWN